MNTHNAACAAAAFQKRQHYLGSYVKHLHKQTGRQLNTSAWKSSWCISAYMRVNGKKQIHLLTLANRVRKASSEVVWTSAIAWKYGCVNDSIAVVWSAVLRSVRWLEHHPFISFLRRPFTTVWRKEALPARILDSGFAKQVLFVSAALEVLFVLDFSNPVILSMPLQCWTNVTVKQIYVFPSRNPCRLQLNTACCAM